MFEKKTNEETMIVNLGRELRSTILNLETVRDKQDHPDQRILDAITRLYEQLVSFVDVPVVNTMPVYKEAAKAMHEAADATGKILENPVSLEEAIGKVTIAIDKVSYLLSI